MARYTFGKALDEDDVLVVQGVEYPMNPIGMRAVKRMLVLSKTVDANRKEDDPITEQELDIALDMVIGVVRPEYRDKFREHIDESVSPDMLIQIANAVMGSFSDLDPTQPGSSSDGSPPTGPGSMDGAPVAALMPSI